MKVRWFALLVLCSLALSSVSLFAQSAEISPYAAYYWPSNNISNSNNNQVGDFMNGQMFGVRGGGYVTHGFEIGGNWAWLNHFQPDRTDQFASFAESLGFPQDRVHANLWELEFTYNFGKRAMLGSTVRPYIVGGTGGITTSVKNNGTFVLNVTPVNPFGTFAANDVLDNQTFFTFSYGGGVKAMRLWGPLGFFGDIRGRTTPNFFGNSMTWPELSAGLNFSWGEH